MIDRMQALKPDLLVITGDIIDKDYCLDWIAPILGRLSAPLGRYFVFGNHECRIKSIAAASQRMQDIGWFDFGDRRCSNRTRVAGSRRFAHPRSSAHDSGW